MEKLKRKTRPIELCPFCNQEKNYQWIYVSPGHRRQYRLCCDKKEKQNTNSTFVVHKYKDAVAFGFDKKTGQPLAIDKKGRRFDPHNTRYADYHDDKYGWKATGKVKVKKTYHI